MTHGLTQALDLIERCDAAGSAAAAGEVMLDAIRPLGANSLWARTFDLCPNWTDPKVNMSFKVHSHTRIRRADWLGSQAQRHADALCPLGEGAARFNRPFICHELTREKPRQYASYYEALSGYDVRATLTVPVFGLNNTASALTVWFERNDFAPQDLMALKMSGQMLLDRLRQIDAAPAPPRPTLTPRERDCMAFVAEGKSDWEISIILGLSQATAHAHVENAKRKLGARTRAQAVARFMLLRLI